METEKRTLSRLRYENKRGFKKVSFNLEKEEALWQFANQTDFSQWVKAKIREELNQAA